MNLTSDILASGKEGVKNETVQKVEREREAVCVEGWGVGVSDGRLIKLIKFLKK